MPTIYRNIQTRKLVHLALCTPPKVLGSHFEETDLNTGNTQRVKHGIERNGHNIVISPKHYKQVAHH